MLSEVDAATSLEEYGAAVTKKFVALSSVAISLARSVALVTVSALSDTV
jgi:hypothetical protein